MALGAYGIKRPADVRPEDAQVLVHFQPDRSASSNFIITQLPATQVLAPHSHNTSTGGNPNEILGGLYDLKLPSSVFAQKGIYTVYIRPIEIRTTIIDCGILSSLPNVKGLVFDLNAIPIQFRDRFRPSELVGYRIEYLELDGSKKSNFFRIVTSNFYCEPVAAKLTNPNQISPRYVYTNNRTNLVFCTLTPTSAPSNNPNAIPFIGQPGQSVIITNTFFNPLALDIEMVDHDFDTLAIALYGNQTKSIDNGIYTLYDLSGLNNIYQQYDLYEVRDAFNDQLYEVRQNRGNNIDFSQAFNNIIVNQ
jgi:hypothetical protein|tara:strand:- start:273 stop:1190 length:918 start_codon:yes stop_codon:yes gene_type:complete